MTSPETFRTVEIADLQHKIDEADTDIALINRRLDESQGMYLEQSLHIRVCKISVMLKHAYWNMHGCRWCRRHRDSSGGAGLGQGAGPV